VLRRSCPCCPLRTPPRLALPDCFVALPPLAGVLFSLPLSRPADLPRLPLPPCGAGREVALGGDLAPLGPDVLRCGCFAFRLFCERERAGCHSPSSAVQLLISNAGPAAKEEGELAGKQGAWPRAGGGTGPAACRLAGLPAHAGRPCCWARGWGSGVPTWCSMPSMKSR
jgi:hypothetical protein